MICVGKAQCEIRVGRILNKMMLNVYYYLCSNVGGAEYSNN